MCDISNQGSPSRIRFDIPHIQRLPRATKSARRHWFRISHSSVFTDDSFVLIQRPSNQSSGLSVSRSNRLFPFTPHFPKFPRFGTDLGFSIFRGKPSDTSSEFEGGQCSDGEEGDKDTGNCGDRREDGGGLMISFPSFKKTYLYDP